MIVLQGEVGSLKTIELTYKNKLTGALTDVTVTAEAMSPTGEKTTLTAVRQSEGVYQVSFTPTKSGTWTVRALSSGALAVATEDIVVRVSETRHV